MSHAVYYDLLRFRMRIFPKVGFVRKISDTKKFLISGVGK